MVEHLLRLGVTAVELLPVHTFVDDKRLVELGLRNYWGYNTIGFFAPDMRYSATGTLGEFKTMVKRCIAPGIEVILDVVYNHTAEGNHLGPTISFRGIDNAVYYRLAEDTRGIYLDYTGTGNTLSTQHPIALRLIFDSLRYWVTEMHVDGFRFDLASTLAREQHAFDHFGAFLDIARQDPVLSQVKLIAEPWDLGEGGYQVGGFPPGWSDWNGRYRDAVRSYWKGDGGLVGELASRLSGIERHLRARRTRADGVDQLHHGARRLHAARPRELQRQAQRSQRREQPATASRTTAAGTAASKADRPTIEHPRAAAAADAQSPGHALLLAGRAHAAWPATRPGARRAATTTPIARTTRSRGCDWDLGRTTRRRARSCNSRSASSRCATSIRLFRRLTFFRGRAVRDSDAKDIVWLQPDGGEMSDEEWSQGHARCLGAHLSGRGLSERDEHGVPVEDDDLMLLLNASDQEIAFRLGTESDAPWHVRVDTDGETGVPAESMYPGGAQYPLRGRSLVLLCRPRLSR